MSTLERIVFSDSIRECLICFLSSFAQNNSGIEILKLSMLNKRLFNLISSLYLPFCDYNGIDKFISLLFSKPNFLTLNDGADMVFLMKSNKSQEILNNSF